MHCNSVVHGYVFNRFWTKKKRFLVTHFARHSLEGKFAMTAAEHTVLKAAIVIDFGFCPLHKSINSITFHSATAKWV